MEVSTLPRATRPPSGPPVPRWSPAKFAAKWAAAKVQDRRLRAMDLAVAAGVNPNTVYNWRMEGGTKPNIDQAFALAAVLGCDLADLVE